MTYDPNWFLKKRNGKAKWIKQLDWTDLAKRNWEGECLKILVWLAAKNALGKEFKNTEWAADWSVDDNYKSLKHHKAIAKGMSMENRIKDK